MLKIAPRVVHHITGGSVRKLIGLEEVCEGCVDCMDMAKRCVEYGPLRFQVLKGIKKPIHYRKLHISDK